MERKVSRKFSLVGAKPSRDHLAGIDSPAAFTHYEQRIRALTTLLDRAACHEAVTNLDPSDPDSNSELRSYYFLATLLTTGTHETNCAVSAIVLPNLVKCIVAVLGDQKTIQMGCMPKTEVHQLQERQIDLITLGTGPSNPVTVPFEEHAADLLHALRTFRTALGPASDESPYWYFLRFIIRRCYLKIADRISNGDKIWRKHPMALLRKWEPPSSKSGFKRTEFKLKHQLLQATLAVYDIYPISEDADGHVMYYFAKDNAKAWAQTACALFGVLQEKLMTPYFDGHSPLKQVPRATIDAESVVTVADYLDTFAMILDLEPMKEILKHPSYTSKLQPIADPLPVNQNMVSPLGDDPDSNALAKDEQESPGEHVFRYLRAIVSWVNASLSLTQHEIFRNQIPIELYVVHVPPDRDRRLTALEGIQQEILGRLGEDTEEEENAAAFFRDEKRIMNPQNFDGSVHTECAVLGILADGGSPHSLPAVRDIFSYHGQPLGNLAEVFQQGYVAIGGTRNCCACCWRLAQELGREYDREIVLSGTHGIIRPWTPPRMGISVTHLREVDTAMVDTLRELAVDPKQALQLRQTKSLEISREATRLKSKASSSGRSSCFPWC
ncbi:hypothetical protein EIP86_006927 [Pleurotus ostreatoroseus]|nr:hypothetical protein EIP86_006927 [Pleurotus ostreatoroseus]